MNPQLRYNIPPWVNTQKRRDVIARLTGALYDFLTLDLDETEAAKAMMDAQPIMATASVTPEMLIRAQEDLQGTRDAMENAAHSFDSFPEDLREGMLAALQAPFQMQIRQQERYLSDLQARMEAEAVPAGPTEPTT